ncbi:MAG: hypothetical protein CMF41_00850 [Legionellales bacterium]|nr:hypothetical protein [Legionellales bacterium]OUX66214.1 MAG: hypothetical protein CBE41_00470 [Gammaproteobacteria bacterium TMED281]
MGIDLLVLKLPPCSGGMERQAYLQARELSKSLPVTVYSTSKDIELFDNDKSITFKNIKTQKGFALKERLTILIFCSYLISRNKNEICYVHQSHLLALFLALYLRLNPNIKLFIKIANSGFKFDLNMLTTRYKFPKKIISKVFSHKRISFLCLNREIRSQLLDYGIENEKIIDFRNGVQIGRMKYELQNSQKRKEEFLFLGRLEKVKNLDFILKCAERYKNYNFTIVGDGNEKYRLLNIISSNNIKNVIICGEIPQQELNFNNYGWLVLPSLAEGMSNVMLEASANSLGIICQDISANDFIKSINNYVIPCSKFLNEGVDSCNIDFKRVQRKEFKFYSIENVCNNLLKIMKQK